MTPKDRCMIGVIAVLATIAAAESSGWMWVGAVGGLITFAYMIGVSIDDP